MCPTLHNPAFPFRHEQGNQHRHTRTKIRTIHGPTSPPRLSPPPFLLVSAVSSLYHQQTKKLLTTPHLTTNSLRRKGPILLRIAG